MPKRNLRVLVSRRLEGRRCKSRELKRRQDKGLADKRGWARCASIQTTGDQQMNNGHLKSLANPDLPLPHGLAPCKTMV